jgi:hypothetical protein
MKIDMSTKVQNSSPLYSFQNTSRGKKVSNTFKLDLSESSIVTATQNSADDAEITGLMQAINEEITEMMEKIKNGEVEEEFQTGSTSLTNEEWERLLKKFDISEDAIKKATVEKSQNTTEVDQEQATTDNQLSQQTSENTGIDSIAHLYKQYQYKA